MIRRSAISPLISALKRGRPVVRANWSFEAAADGRIFYG